MFALHVIQAGFGDCLIVEAGTPQNRKFILIDGGPENTFHKHLRGKLAEIDQSGGKLDLVILSHVDGDHIIGLLDLMAELSSQRTNNQEELIAIDALWHNSFSRTLGQGNNIEARIKIVAANAKLANTGNQVQKIEEGHGVRLAAIQLGIPLNPSFANDVILAKEGLAAQDLGEMRIKIVGPTQPNLDALKNDWLEWLDAHEDDFASGDPSLAANADDSVPNKSSIMVLVEAEGKKLLLTGDGRSDHLIDGLKLAGLLDANEKFHVDMLKMMHHGSDRNVTKKFLKSVTADTYVFSANGRDGNPDLSTLGWLVEAAHDQNRPIRIVATNKTTSTTKLIEEFDPAEFGYQLTLMDSHDHVLTLPLTAV